MNAFIARSTRFRRNPAVLVAALLFLVLYGALIAVQPTQLSPFSFNNLAVLVTSLGLAAAGTTLVLLTGGFDLSVAGVISLANVTAATMMSQAPDQVWLISVLVIVIGAGVGLVNGWLVSVVGLQSIAVTLATFIVLSGAALMVLPAPGGTVPETFTRPLTTRLGALPVALLVLLAVATLWVLFARTRTGMAAPSIGADIGAARMSGIPVRRVQIICYTLAGALYSCAGLYLSAATASGDPNAGRPFLLTAFAAMALGLVSFRGGSGSVAAAIFGAASLMVIPKLLFAAGIADFWTGAVQGTVILAALAVPVIGTAVHKSKNRRNPNAVIASQPGVAPDTFTNAR
ncbi:ABC transporter permease [Arthrobacter sp. SA17]